MTNKNWRNFSLLVMATTTVLMLTICGFNNLIDLPVNDKLLNSNPKLAQNFRISFYNENNLLVDNEASFYTLLQNDKPIVLNLWAGLCPPCRAEMPEMEEVYKEYSDRIILFGLDLGPFMALGSKADGLALVKELEITYPTGTTDNSDVIQNYKVLGLPTTLFIKANGEIIRSWIGLIHKEKLAELMDDLIESN